MNKILVEVSVGELLDKISILEIKQEKIKDHEKLKFIKKVPIHLLHRSLSFSDKIENFSVSGSRVFYNFELLPESRFVGCLQDLGFDVSLEKTYREKNPSK